MKTDISKYTNYGGHTFNEDSYGCGDNVFVVADGLGSHENSKAASQTTVEYILKNLNTADAISYDFQRMESEIQAVNQAVLAMQEQTGYRESRTTLAAAWLSEEKFRCVNIGDSRVYFFRQGRVFQQTTDHSVCQAAVLMGDIAPWEIRKHPDRSKLLKVLGDHHELNVPELLPVVDVYDGDAFLICSDGFWEFVYEEEMEFDLHKSATANEWLGYMLRRQLARAQNREDNYTVICGIIHSERQYIPPPESKIKKEKKRKKFSLKIICILLAVLLLLSGGGIAVWKLDLLPKLLHTTKDDEPQLVESRARVDRFDHTPDTVGEETEPSVEEIVPPVEETEPSVEETEPPMEETPPKQPAIPENIEDMINQNQFPGMIQP